MKWSFGAVFCFPNLVDETGEAWGKQQEVGRGARTTNFGMYRASNLPRRAAPNDSARPPDSLPSRRVGVLPQIAGASWICFPGCFPSFVSERAAVIVQLPHQPDALAS